MGAQGVIHPKDVIITLLSSHKYELTSGGQFRSYIEYDV